jgi:hypothetical protein
VLIGQDASRQTLGTAAGFSLSWLTIHQAGFIAWAVATGLHVMARLLLALKTVRSRQSSPDGTALRVTVVLVVLTSSVVLSLLLLSQAAGWGE